MNVHVLRQAVRVVSRLPDHNGEITVTENSKIWIQLGHGLELRATEEKKGVYFWQVWFGHEPLGEADESAIEALSAAADTIGEWKNICLLGSERWA